jgi:hypothetical protein
MKPTHWRNTLIIMALYCAGDAAAVAGDFSFGGFFSRDDEVKLFDVSVGAASTVTLRTLSFGGGTNRANIPIPAGGFPPILSLFDSGGNLIAQDRNASSADCGQRPVDPASKYCWDAYLSMPLGAGNYVLALTEDANAASGLTLAEGFSQAGLRDFTGPLFVGVEGAFYMANLTHRSNRWAVDITGVNGAAPRSSDYAVLKHSAWKRALKAH